MVKLRELTKKDLIDEISELRQKVIELEMEITRLQRNIWEAFPVKPTPILVIQPEWQPWIPTEAGRTGDPLPNLPMTVCWGF